MLFLLLVVFYDMTETYPSLPILFTMKPNPLWVPGKGWAWWSAFSFAKVFFKNARQSNSFLFLLINLFWQRMRTWKQILFFHQIFIVQECWFAFLLSIVFSIPFHEKSKCLWTMHLHFVTYFWKTKIPSSNPCLHL